MDADLLRAAASEAFRRSFAARREGRRRPRRRRQAGQVQRRQAEEEEVRRWSKGKHKEKVNNAVLFDQPTTYDKLLSEVIYLSTCSLDYVLCWLRCLSMSGNRSYEK